MKAKLAGYPAIFAKFASQTEVEAEIEKYIRLAGVHEARRDASPFESSAYWGHHDMAMKWIYKAESLMS